ncbi:uncharacterized protein LOC135082060 [Ostrinia nubilalis]|uniref:uncharacterized protein LOC135082060 n=1 Tax=Ostrinia nubilalis TaxID=29057 RepID=UPI0030822FA8
MFIPAIVEFFKYKLVGSIFVLACWSSFDEVKFAKKFYEHGISVTFACDPEVLGDVSDFKFQGVLFIDQENFNLLKKVNRKHFSHWYKWLIVSKNIPDALHSVRYDNDMTILRETESFDNNTLDTTPTTINLYFDEIYVHPQEGATQHEWAHWSDGLQVTHEWERTQRRKDVKKYPFRIVAPVAHYSEEVYKGSFAEYLEDLTAPDAGLRCGYGASSLIIEAVNATRVLVPAKLWYGTQDVLGSESADLNAGVLRIMETRMEYLDYIMPIWLFSVGFTYLAERESSSNMYVEPFTAACWWTCLGIGVTLALAQRVAARGKQEKEGAFMAVLATWLQQDAAAVPDGVAGRWTFTVMSICAMLVHAYYTSAIVSALMSTGRGGPNTLRELADSRYAIASEDHDFIRNGMFNVETDWEELEYLKKKKMTSKLFQDMEYGVQLIQQGYTAYHAEYHQLYHFLEKFSDDEICKMQHVDTIPEIMTWVSASARGQWTEIFRSTGAWLYETGLARQLLSSIQTHPPPCRAAMLAERVTFWDVAPLLGLTTIGAIASIGLLGMEIVLHRWTEKNRREKKWGSSEASLVALE